MKSHKFNSELFEQLPDPFKKLLSQFKDKDKDLLLLACLTVLGVAMPNITGYYRGKKTYPYLYVFIIAGPGSGKSVVMITRSLIMPIHMELLDNSRKAIDEWKKANKGKKDLDYSTCPSLQVKIIPANISSTELINYLNIISCGILIMESEADSLGKMFKNDWSNHSDILRKAYENEPVSIARKTDRVYISVEKPKLSVLITGTPNQFTPIIESYDDGLASRFMLYHTMDVEDFNVSFEPVEKEDVFKSFSPEVYKMYKTLMARDKEIIFSLTEEQQVKLNEKFSALHKSIKENYNPKFLSSVNRGANQLYSIAMILTGIRNIDNLMGERLICADEDFDTATSITITCLKNSLQILENWEKNYLTDLERRLLDGVNNRFTNQEAIRAVEDVHEKTVYNTLNKLINKELIKRLKNGIYEKIKKK